MTASTQIQVRRDTAANWTTTNPILAAGEIGLETDSGRLKVGDGVTSWNTITTYFSKIYLGIFATSGALPAAANNVGCFALVGSGIPYLQYQSNGATWLPDATLTASQVTALAADVNLGMVLGAGSIIRYDTRTVAAAAAAAGSIPNVGKLWVGGFNSHADCPDHQYMWQATLPTYIDPLCYFADASSRGGYWIIAEENLDYRVLVLSAIATRCNSSS